MNEKLAKRERTRHPILGAAGRLFRQHGFKPIRIDRVIKSIGMTVGGFSNHFDSKEKLLGEVVGSTVSGVVEGSQNDADRPIREWDGILDLYLSQWHGDHPGDRHRIHTGWQIDDGPRCE